MHFCSQIRNNKLQYRTITLANFKILFSQEVDVAVKLSPSDTGAGTGTTLEIWMYYTSGYKS
jgi:hypothetical protein